MQALLTLHYPFASHPSQCQRMYPTRSLNDKRLLLVSPLEQTLLAVYMHVCVKITNAGTHCRCCSYMITLVYIRITGLYMLTCICVDIIVSLCNEPPLA